MKPSRTSRLALLLCGALALALPAFGQKPQDPITKDGLIKALKIGGLSQAELVQRINARGVEFLITDDVERDLREAGAADEIIEACKTHYGSNRRDLLGSVPGADDGEWLVAQRSDAEAFYCKPRTIKRQPDGNLRVWIKHKWFGPLDAGNYTLIFEDFDCAHKTVRVLASATYKDSGELTEYHQDIGKKPWPVLRFLDPLLDFVCSHAPAHR